MKSRLYSFSKFFISIVSFLVPAESCAQQTSLLEVYQRKFPAHPLIYELDQKEVFVDISAGKPRLKVDEYSSRVILIDNSTTYSDFKYYFSRNLKIKKFNAYSLVPEGSRYSKFPVSEYIKSTEIDDGIFYDDEFAYSFNFKFVKKGTKLIIESTTEILDPVTPIHFTFQHHSPVEKAKISISVPAGVKIIFKLFGGPDTALIRHTVSVKGKRTVHSWETEDLGEFVEDRMAPDLHYYIPHIIIQIAGYQEDGKFVPVVGTVDDLYRQCYENLKDTIYPEHGKIKELGDSLTAGITSSEAKVNVLYCWVQKQIKYVAIEDGENAFVPCDAEMVLQRKYGDCKGKTSLLVNLLRSQNLKASFAWVGTRSIPYRITEFPSRADINHMIAVWWNESGAPVILDGTTYFNAMHEIPAAIQGKECLIEKGRDDYLVYQIPIAPPIENTCSDSVVVSIQGLSLAGTGKGIFNGERKIAQLHAFNLNDTSHFRDLLKSELPKASNKFIINSISMTNPAETGKDFQANYSFVLPEYLTATSNRLFVNMNLDRFLSSLSMEKNRKMPVEAEHTINFIFSCTLKIPPLYIPEKIPAPSSFTDSEFGFTQTYMLKNNDLVLQTRIWSSFQIISGEKLERFSQMLSELNVAYSKSIVLVKK